MILGWIFDFEGFIRVLPGGASMKFNTALCFVLSGIGLWITYVDRKNNHWIPLVIIGLLIFIGVFTLLDYSFDLPLNIDNIFIEDVYSQRHPGRMSVATAFCFLLFAFGLHGVNVKTVALKKTAQFLLHTITFISFLSIVSYTLQVPAENKIYFLNTMAIHTSVLFFFLSVSLSLVNSTLGFTGLLTSSSAGSKLLKLLLPFLILLPVILGYLWMLSLELNWMDSDFGVVLFSVIFIILSISYISMIAVVLNKSDQRRVSLENLLLIKNQELNYFKQALDQSAIVSITKPNGVISYVNEQFCKISKYSTQELIGKKPNIVNSGFHNKAFIKGLWNTIRRGEVWGGEIRNKAKDGSFYWVHSSIVPFMDESGEIYQYLDISKDITQRKKEEELLASQYVRGLEEKNKELEHFAYVVSHDLKAPLRGIYNLAHFIESDLKSNQLSEIPGYLKTLYGRAKRMDNLIEGILNYTKIGMVESNKEEIDLNKLVREIFNDLNTSEQFQLKLENRLPVVFGVSAMMQQLFANLIGNAIKFNDKTEGILEIDGVKVNGGYRFVVADNGPGISEEYHEKVFQVFQTLSARDTFESTGIGLSIVRKIIDELKGTVTIEANEPEGVRFVIFLPLLIDQK
ncbi:MAG: ATP-binding protein [Cyclobacteriaceae bacterium]|nr:ATP-binding protein [Cyclobacteriaceae bacterium]